MEEVLVSIWCTTYNHELYIKDAIEGFLTQKTEFRYEIWIHDDASFDKTAEIVKGYEQKYPDLIHGIYETENQYSKNRSYGKYLEKLERQYCKGKYIAFCEGDDYWIDCYKLQIQVNYMERHPECSLNIHNALRFDCRTGAVSPIDPYDGAVEKDISAEELIMQYKGHPPTASMLYRKKQEHMPDFFLEAPVGDYTKQLYMFTKGKVHYSSRIMSVYRFFSKDSYNSRLDHSKEMAFYFNLGLFLFLIQFDKYTDRIHHEWVRNKIQGYASAIANSIDENVSLEEYVKRCKKHGYYFTSISKKYCQKLEGLRQQVSDYTFCSDAVKSFIGTYDNIIVMGKGRYSEKIVKQFKANGIDFKGFAVSNKVEGEDWFKGKPVWNLSELPFSRKEVGVIVAINPINWDDILRSLDKAGIKHYICPFFLEI